MIPKEALPLIFKWTEPRSVTHGSVASMFSRPELETSALVMTWRVALNEADVELTPRKSLWFLPGESFPLEANSCIRIV